MCACVCIYTFYIHTLKKKSSLFDLAKPLTRRPISSRSWKKIQTKQVPHFSRLGSDQNKHLPSSSLAQLMWAVDCNQILHLHSAVAIEKQCKESRHRRFGEKKGTLQLIVNKNGILSFRLNYFQLSGKICSCFPMLVLAFNSSDHYAQIQVLFTCSWSTVLILLLWCPCYRLRYILGSSACLHKYLVILC